MSDSEDDFMSDKYLVEAPTTAPQSYSTKRSIQQLKSQRASQAKNMISSKQLEAERRHAGLNTSLFETINPTSSSIKDNADSAGESSSGGNKAMEMMMKMGWKVGEGLGRKRSPFPSSESKRQKIGEEEVNQEEGLLRSGIGSSSRITQPRLEPIRVSMWAGRKGLSARSPSPPPLPSANRDPDALDPKKLARLGQETESFRERQRREFAEKEIERKEWKAREMLVKFDIENGIKFHPLHVIPSDPLQTLPKPLIRLIYPNVPISPTRSPSPPAGITIKQYGKEKNLTAAEKMREQIRRDMLEDLEEDEGVVRFGVEGVKSDINNEKKENDEVEGTDDGGAEEVDWESMVSGTKKVLSMDPSIHLAFLVSQLRHEHLYCFWCSHKYGSYEEMDAPGGCPGEEEDEH